MWDLRTAGSSKKLRIHQIFPSENLDKLQLVLRGWLAGHLEKKVFLRRIGLLLYGVSDPFPLTIPRWRWGMRILQGKGSLPLGNKPRPGGSIKILSWAQVGRWSLKTATTHQRRTWTTTATSVTLIVGRSSFWTLWSTKSALRPCWRTLPVIYILQDALGRLRDKTQNKLFKKINKNCIFVCCACWLTEASQLQMGTWPEMVQSYLPSGRI